MMWLAYFFNENCHMPVFALLNLQHLCLAYFLYTCWLYMQITCNLFTHNPFQGSRKCNMNLGFVLLKFSQIKQSELPSESYLSFLSFSSSKRLWSMKELEILLLSYQQRLVCPRKTEVWIVIQGKADYGFLPI
jgi:hypothetical protein